MNVAGPIPIKVEVVSSSNPECEGCVPMKPRPSRAGDRDCSELARELANTLTAVMLNAQVLQWRLPPYSRMKRPVVEIERQAQRGAELVKRLLLWSEGFTQEKETEPGGSHELCGQGPGGAGLR